MPRRVTLAELEPGTRSALLRFERAARDHAFLGAKMPEYWNDMNAQFDAVKQAIIRKLLRLEGKIPPAAQGRRKSNARD